jgi:hypothetical protein
MEVIDNMVTLQTIATSRNTPEVRSLPSPGITRLPRYYEPVRLPAKPEPSLAGVPLALHVPLDRVSRVARLIPLLRAVTITPAGPGRGVRRSPEPWLRPSPSVRRVGSCNARFRGLHGVHMCCQQTSQHGITARKLAEWLNHPLTPKASYGFVTSTITSAASGWNDRVAGWVSHPQDKPNLCTAHAPKVRNVKAQGNALGNRGPVAQSPNGALSMRSLASRPGGACENFARLFFPGRCLGL